MISAEKEKRLLQITIAIACLVPLYGAFSGFIYGTGFLQKGHVNRDLDSHFRYLSGLLLGVALSFLSVIPNIEYKKSRTQILTFIVVAGGISRLVGFFIGGIPDNSMIFALVMELVITPVLCLWQLRLANRMHAQLNLSSHTNSK